MLLALVLSPILLYPFAVAGHPEESSICPSHFTSSFPESDSRYGRAGLLGDHDQEGLSLLQVGAKRLQKAAAVAKSAAATKTAADVSTSAMAQEGGAHAHPSAAADQLSPIIPAVDRNRSSAAAFVEILVATTAKVARQGQGRVAALLKHARTKSSYTLSIVIVAVVGVVALALLALALQPGHATRDRSATSISQNFPRATQSGPYGRQGGPGSAYYPAPDSYKVPGYNPYGAGHADSRPSYRDSFMPPLSVPYQHGQQPSPPDSLQGSMTALPDPSQHRSFPRGSTPPIVSPRGPPLPRVQGPGARLASSSRPGTGLNLTPAHSLAPMNQTILPAPDVHHAPEVTGSAPRRPPPLCPMLVLPHCESFFSVPVDQLVAGTSTVEILGLSGNALLRSTVKDTEEGRVVEVSMSPPRSPALASISTPAASGPKAGCRQLKGSRGKHYGWLRPTASGYVLRCGEDDVMTVITSTGTGQLQLYAGSSGDMLAQASRSGDGEGIFAADDLEVRVTPGMDAVLAILCVISAALFAEGPTPFSFRPTRRSGMA